MNRNIFFHSTGNVCLFCTRSHCYFESVGYSREKNLSDQNILYSNLHSYFRSAFSNGFEVHENKDSYLAELLITKTSIARQLLYLRVIFYPALCLN